MGLGLVLLLPQTEELVLGGTTRADCSMERAGKQVCRPAPRLCVQLGMRGRADWPSQRRGALSENLVNCFV